MILNEREYQRHLPHFQNGLRTYFATFVTHRRWVLPPEARDIAYAATLKQHEKTAFVYTSVVMPDHIHLILQPLWNESGVSIALSEIHRLVNGRSARLINQALRRIGPVWQQESFDHQIRGEESLIEKCEYVAQNPVRKGLCSSPDEWPWLFRWWRSETAETG